MNRLITVLAVAALLTSCVSQRTREEAGMPAALLAWGTSDMGVRSDIERGIADAVEDGDASAALLTDDVDNLDAALRAESYSRVQFAAIPWAELEPMGYRGIEDRIEDGEMTDMVAESLRERMRNFSDLMGKLQTAHFVLITPGPEPRFDDRVAYVRPRARSLYTETISR